MSGLLTRIAERAKVSLKYRRRMIRQALEPLWFKFGGGREHTRRIEGLRNRYLGRRCFVICNGPSLRSTDVRLLKDEITIGSNAIFLLFGETGFRPTFLTVEDPLVADDRSRELNALKEITKIFPKDLAHELEPDPWTTYIRFIRVYRDFPTFSPNLELRAYWGGTVTFLNLQLAYHLGCNPIYIIGCDHSYKVPSNLSSSVITSETDDVNHFHKDYFGKGYRWHDPRVDRMEDAYRAAHAFCESRGVKIFNATAGGHLEVFPRANFAELFSSGMP